MKWLGIVLVWLGLATVALPSTAGSFRGVIVQPPPSTSADWIYVQGNNRLVRKVNVSDARLTYSDDVPQSERQSAPLPSLEPGTEVRVTAEQDGSGEWKASIVEILHLPSAKSDERKRLASTTVGR